MLKKALLSFIFMAFFSAANAAITPVTPSTDSEGCYAIGTKEELYGFAEMVNAEDYGYYSSPVFNACVKLTADITVNEGVLNDDGSLAEGSFESWTPIQRFNGSFDGQGHVIFGLYTDVSGNEYADAAGFIAEVNAKSSSSTVSAEIKNVGLEDSYFKGKSNAGAFVGKVVNNGAKLTITNSYSTSNVVGGSNSYDGVGGFVGYNSETVNIYNSYFAGSLRPIVTSNKDAFIGSFDVYSSNNSVENSFYVNSNSDFGSLVSDGDMRNGRVAAKLHSYLGAKSNGSIWGQNVAAGDSKPNFKGELNGISGVSRLTYHFADGSSIETLYLEGEGFSLPTTIANHIVGEWYTDKNLTNEVEYLYSDMTGNLDLYTNGLAISEPEKDGRNCYLISNAAELYGFAAIVNGDYEEGRYAENYACGKLTADITVNKDVVGDAGFVNEGNYVSWIPIGTNYGNAFKGIFDGNNHSISGLYIKIKNAPILSRLSAPTETQTPAVLRAPSYQNNTRDNMGLFGYVQNSGDYGESTVIKNLTLRDSYFTGVRHIGGIVGYVGSNTLLNVENVHNKATVESEDGDIGGIVGYADYYAKLNFKTSSNEGRVSSNFENVGGFVGHAKQAQMSFENVYNVASVEGYKAGGLVGYLEGQNVVGATPASISVVNSYVDNEFEENTDLGNFIGNSTNAQVNVINSFYKQNKYFTTTYGDLVNDVLVHNGFVAHLLNIFNDGSVDGSVWGQNVTNGDLHPNFSGTLICDFEKKITYHLSDGTTVTDTYISGIGAELPGEIEDKKILGWFTSDSYSEKVDAISSLETEDLDLYGRVTTLAFVDGYYEISSAAGLYEFATLVNSGETYANARLTQDIVVNTNVLKADGTLNGNGSSFKTWTPIGDYYNHYQGEFDGQGHVISGLYSTVSDAGLFGYVGSAEVHGIGIEDSYFEGDKIGSFVGVVYDQYVDIYDCYSTSTLKGATVGGFVGFVAGESVVYIANAFYVGKYEGSLSKDAFVGSTHSIDPEIYLYNAFVPEILSTRWEDASVVPMESFENGYVATILHGNYYMWGQDVVAGDKLPNFSGEVSGNFKFVGLVKFVDDEFWSQESYAYENNFELPVPSIPGYRFEGWYTDYEFTGEPITEIPEGIDYIFGKFVSNVDSEGCYEIASADDLYLFADRVNNGVNNANVACAKLTADIVVNENVLKEDGSLNGNGSNLRKWTPIGSLIKGIPFQGTFDGQGHKISGLYFNDGASAVGLFGFAVQGASIKNVGVVDSYIRGESNVGMIVGQISGEVNISNVYTKGAVEVSRYQVGGIVGFIAGVLTIENSYNEASVTGPYSNSYAGGLVGFLAMGRLSINNCYNLGTVSAPNTTGGLVGFSSAAVSLSNSYNLGEIIYDSMLHDDVGAVVGYTSVSNLTVSNVFYLEGDLGFAGQGSGVSSLGTPKSLDDFANGSVAALLRGSDENSIWGQNVTAGDKYPNFSGSIVKPELVLTWDETSEEVNVADLEIPAEATSIAIEDGKQFFANGKIYEGELTAEDIQDLKAASATLKPISGVALAKDGDGEGVVATLDINDPAAKLVIPEDIEVSKVDIGINFVPGKTMTLMLPFDYDVPEGLGTISEFTRVEKIDGVWTATGTRVSNNHIKAHTPYLIHVAEESDGTLASGSVTIKANINVDSEAGEGSWTFKGTYEGKTWVAGDPELGHAYGFAGQQKDNVSPGDFVRVGAGAAIPPMRAYLVHASAAVQPEPAGMPAARYAPEEPLPKRIVVRIIDGESGDVLEEGEMDGSGEIQSLMPVKSNFEAKENRWHDIKGRHLNHKPNAKGAYLKNGKPVLVK